METESKKMERESEKEMERERQKKRGSVQTEIKRPPETKSTILHWKEVVHG